MHTYLSFNKTVSQYFIGFMAYLIEYQIYRLSLYLSDADDTISDWLLILQRETNFGEDSLGASTPPNRDKHQRAASKNSRKHRSTAPLNANTRQKQHPQNSRKHLRSALPKRNQHLWVAQKNRHKLWRPALQNSCKI